MIWPAASQAKLKEAVRIATKAGRSPRPGLLDFVLATHPKYQAGWFHAHLCRALEEFSRAVAAKESPCLIIAAPPQHGKSLLVSQALPVFHLAHNPEHHVAVTSYGSDLAEEHLRKSRFLLQSEDTQQRWPHLVPASGDKLLVHRADLDEVPGGGSLRAIGVGGGLSGKPVTMLVMDDLLKDRMEADSKLIRDRVWAWMNDVAFTRVPDGGGKLLMATRWHEDDPTGRLLRHESGKWKLLWYPAIDETDKRRAPGGLLHPERYGQAFYDDVQGRSQRTWHALYQQEPLSETGGGLSRENFRIRYTADPVALAATCDEVWISSDAAQKGADSNDYHAIQIYGRKGGLRYVLDRLTDKMTPTIYDQTMDGLVEKWSLICQRARIPLNVLVEDAANGAHWLETRRGRFAKAHLFAFSPNLVPGKDKSKPIRWGYFVRDATAEQIILPAAAPWSEDLLGWWLAGLRAAHDDDADCASQLSVWLEVGGQKVAAVDALAFLDDMG